MRKKISWTERTPRPRRICARLSTPHRLVALLVVAAAATVTGCRKDPLAGLPELPADLASNLQVVPGRPLLATKIRTKAAPSNQPPPPCAADSTSTYYDARITTPITLCWNPYQTAPVAVFDEAFMPAGQAVTHYKLSGATAIAHPADAAVFHSPFFCSTSNGPWSADLESDRQCVGECSPQNSLIVVGIPATVQFFWDGPFGVPPAGAPFKFVDAPTKIDFVDWGRCHAEPGGGQARARAQCR